MFLTMRRRFGTVAARVLGDRYKLGLAYIYYNLKKDGLFLKPNKFGEAVRSCRLASESTC
jgi:hypothetical protein